ncbi:hypothetical protein fugu_015847 [Takifugu bimaculatus]|uniref:Uncharacterized protein n=1 Tax=Takifugu bimaculatus TaxID=433685 RepID=A0A4Z2BXA4_9TELE|nr:hypothetical protein fugu_015847 [Takifugu bimaculatus]
MLCPCDIGDRMDYGQEVQVEHIQAYLVKPTSPSDKTIIVIQDIFGGNAPTPDKWLIFWLPTNTCMQREQQSVLHQVLHFIFPDNSFTFKESHYGNLQSVLHGSVYWQIYRW